MVVEAGDRAPEFTLPSSDGAVTLSDTLAAGPVVVLFYQEDGTPTCQAQLCAFRDDYDLVRELGATVLAISTDSVGSHQDFAARLQSPYPLLSDQDGLVAQTYGVYDAAARRAQRAAFVIRRNGVVRLALPWFNPANSGQFEEVFSALQALAEEEG